MLSRLIFLAVTWTAGAADLQEWENRDYAGSLRAEGVEVLAVSIIDEGELNEGDQGSWGHLVLGPDGNFYAGTGNHEDDSLLVRYNPSAKTGEIVLNSRIDFGHDESKWHGRPDIDPRQTINGQPNPAFGDLYLVGTSAGYIEKYNVFTEAHQTLGRPQGAHGIMEHVWNWQTGTLFGISGLSPEVLIYDTLAGNLIHYGLVPAAGGGTFEWGTRGRHIDWATNVIYGTDTDRYIVEYDIEQHVARRLNLRMDAPLRAQTEYRDKNGNFWYLDHAGYVYRFNPQAEILEKIGPNVPDGPDYASQLAISPGGRYFYFGFAGSETGKIDGNPIIQYDTETHQSKVIAILQNYTMQYHNYGGDGSKIYGVALTMDGSELVAITNGEENGARRVAFVHLAIPEAERQEGPPLRHIRVSDGYSLLGERVDFLVEYETWKNDNFDDVERFATAISGPTATPANDGVTNLMKYAFRLSPKVPARQSDLLSLAFEADELHLVYKERTDVSDIEYKVFLSTDLVEWETGPGAIEEISRVEMGGHSQQVTVAPADANLSSTFLQLQVAPRSD